MKFSVRYAMILASVAITPAMAQQNALVPAGQPQNVLNGHVLDWTPDKDARIVNVVNCSLLKGQPGVCIHNDTGVQVTDIDCEVPAGFFTSAKTRDIALPRGGVAPHATTIVNMKSCKTALIFTLPGGKQKRLPVPQGTDSMTEIEVPK